MYQSIFMLILIYMAYILHFTQNYTDLKSFSFIFGILSDVIDCFSRKCCGHVIEVSQWQASLQLSMPLS